MALPTASPGTSPRVTIALATYGRPDALACAVRSVLLQTFGDWQLLVLGDACGEDTADAMAPFLHDPRIRYVNLPFRCGEQALPNSAAMAVAQGDFIAFLNHDDLWLPDHLETALAVLRRSGDDFFMGRSAWTRNHRAQDPSIAEFFGVSPFPCELSQVFLKGIHYVEPASAWVLRRTLAERVGPWHRAVDLFRTPIQDWVLRAWRAGARLAVAENVTSLKFETHWSREAPTRRYDTSALLQATTVERMERPGTLLQLQSELAALARQPEAVGRGMVLELVSESRPEQRAIAQALLTPQAAELYRETGEDAYARYCSEVGQEQGWRWRWALQLRTGEKGLAVPSLEQVIAHLRQSVDWAEGDAPRA
jgi:hypothetical protein